MSGPIPSYYILGFFSGYIGLIILLFVGSIKVPRLAFYARILASYLTLLVCAAYGVVASIVLRLVGYGQVSQWATARCFKWMMWATTGVRFVVVQGQENLRVRPAVFIGNHQTELDIGCLGTVMPPYCSVTAKKNLKRVPVLGWFMTLSKTVFIDRANRQTAMAAFDGAAAQMRRERHSVYIFPEGTRSYYQEPDLLPFKKGAFHLAIQAKVPIVPVVVANYSHILNVRQRRFVRGNIPISVLPPIPTSHLQPSDVEDLARRTRELMLTELIRLTATIRRDNDHKQPVMSGATAKTTEISSSSRHGDVYDDDDEHDEHDGRQPRKNGISNGGLVDLTESS